MAANPLDNLPRPRPGDPQISATLLNTLIDQAIAARNINGAANVGVGGAAFAQQVRAIDPIYARVTAEASTAGRYEWEQVRPNLSTGEWDTPSNNLTHDNFHGEVLIGGFDADGFTPQGCIDRVYELREILAEDGTTNLIGVEIASKPWYFAKVTASSSIAPDMTLAEVDSAGTSITNGRTPTNAKAPNERAGVPVDTFGVAFELAPTTAGGDLGVVFVPWDGLRTSPKDLVNTGATADATTWNVENQGSFTGADFDPTRAALTIEALFFYDRILKIDSSGFVHDVEGEKETFIAGDAEDSPLNGHITLKTITSGGTNGKKALINQPQATDWSRSVTFYPGTGIELSTTSGGSAESSIAYDCDFDNSGRENHKASLSQDVYIRATGGGGSADGQGYEDVEVNSVSVLAKTDGGIINFANGTTSGTTLGVTFAGSAADPTATVTATVDASGLTAGDVGSAEVLDIEVSVQAAASGTIVLDSDNYSGRMLQYSYAVLLGSTSATWADYVENPANPSAIYVGSAESADVTLVSATDIFVYIDQSDGYKLKLDHSNPGASFPDWLRLTITKGARKTSPDVTVT